MAPRVFACQGGFSVPSKPVFEQATVAEAAKRLEKAPGTIYSWGTRYNARKAAVQGVMYYDLLDLRVIEREIHHGHKVPATWQERAAIRHRCPLKAQTPAAA